MSARLLLSLLGFSIKFPYGKPEKQWGKHHGLMNVSENMLLRFANVLLKLTKVTIFRERHPAKVESNIKT